jgi:hypothetical protein
MKIVRTKRILVAVRPAAHDVMRIALGAYYPIRLCSSFETAKLLLQENFDLIVCGMHFDSSRMFELLQYAKDNPHTRPIHFIGLKIAERPLQGNAVRSIEKAAKLLGADEFFDLARMRTELGDEPAYEQLRAVIDRMLRNAG